MSKKELFEVETIDKFNIGSFELMKGLVDSGVEGCISIKRVQPIPEVKIVETGVLVSPAEITGEPTATSIVFRSENGQTTFVEYSENVHRSFVGAPIPIAKYPYPRSFYKKDSIQKTWNFSSIPVGSLIHITFQSGGFSVGYLNEPVKDWVILRHGDMSCDCIRLDAKEQFKSIRIIELPKDGE